MISLVQAFEQRFDFAPPEAYRLLAADSEKLAWPLLPAFHWLDASEVLAFEFMDHQWPDFVPMGRNSSGDLWCWCPQMEAGDRVPVGICPVNCEEGEVYAPDFPTALFRLICDAVQFLSAAPGQIEAARVLLRACAETTGDALRAEWKEWLRQLSAAPVSRWLERGAPVCGILPRQEYDRALRGWMDDDEVGSVFRWMTPR